MTPIREALAADTLDRLLDADRLRAWLTPVVAGSNDLARADVRYVRAKRDRSLLLGLDLTWRENRDAGVARASAYTSADGVEPAVAKARTLRLLPPANGPALALLRDPDALYLGFPNDRAIRGLAAAADPRRLGNRLRGDAFPFVSAGRIPRGRRSLVRVRRWKPGRRAVLEACIMFRDKWTRALSEERFFVRVYPTRLVRDQLARWRAATRACPEAAGIVSGVDRQRGFILTRAIGGERVRVSPHAPLQFTAGSEEMPLAAISDALSRLHATPLHLLGDLPTRSIADELNAALRVLEDLAGWMPEQRARIEGLARRLSAQRPAAVERRAFVHGDFKLDQMLVGAAGIRLLDWDEAAVGDPLADHASFAADLVLRTEPNGAALEELREGIAGTPAVGEPWRWFMASALARRALAGLQAGRPSWRSDALRTLVAAERTLVAPRRALSRASAAPAASDGFRGRAGVDILRDLLVPSRRERVLGAAERGWTLRAVWPSGNGFTACLDRTGSEWHTVWIQAGSSVGVWVSPNDPDLPELRPLVEGGGFEILSHRFGRRAALRKPHGDREVVHLRPASRAMRAYARLRAVHGALERGGAAASPLLSPLRSGNGWCSRFISGGPLDPRATSMVWRAFGHQIALAHAVEPPVGLEARGLRHARDAAARQITLAGQAGLLLGRWLEEQLQSWSPHRFTHVQATALVHGDLHAGQVVVAETPVILDWEQAGRSDPEEDLGNLVSHLYLRFGRSARRGWQALVRGYRAAGGGIDRERLVEYAWLSLLRMLAVHGWRDEDRARCEARRSDWMSWREEVLKW